MRGRIVAGPHVRDACARHLRDLEHGPARGLRWNLRAAQRAIAFFPDVLCLAGGVWEGKPYDLLDWQAFIVGSLFGWQVSDGTRRFRVAYIETGKGSGKSPLAAGIGLFGLVADGEARAEIYAAATKRDQAMVLFRDAVAMVDQSPKLRPRIKKTGTGENTWNLSYLERGSFFRAISSDEGQSGPRPHIALLDEVHEHRDGRMVENMRAGSKGRTQALTFMITNSGAGRASYCWERHDYAVKVCAGLLEDDAFFGYVCALDEGEEPFENRACWRKANPSLGITIPEKYLEEQIREARGIPSKEATVRRLNFCQWVEAHNPWVSADAWLGAARDYGPRELAGRPCYAGLDLSATTDLTGLVLAFPPQIPGERWRLLPYAWIPEQDLARREQRDRVPYATWVRHGYLETTPGRAVDKAYVVRRVAELASLYELRELAYDRWGLESLGKLCDDEGLSLPLIPFGQGFKDMSPAMGEFERLLVNGELEHPGHPVLTWCAANAIAVEDPAGNRKVAKDRSTGRVDLLVAALMAVGRAIVPDEDHTGPSVYERRGLYALGENRVWA